MPLKLYSESVELYRYALHPVSSALAGVDFNIKALLSLGAALERGYHYQTVKDEGQKTAATLTHLH